MNPQEPSSTIKDVRRIREDAVVVDAVGEIDLESSPHFQRSLLFILDDKPKRVIINLSDVTYMDSSGVASLVKVLSNTRKNGLELYLVGMAERIRSLFEITRLETVFDIRRDEQEALGE